MKTRAPQFELPQAEVAFNLAGETAGDGWKRQQEREQRAQVRQESEKRQENLFNERE